MNFKLGIFRLWLVVSAIWVAASIAFSVFSGSLTVYRHVLIGEYPPCLPTANQDGQVDTLDCDDDKRDWANATVRPQDGDEVVRNKITGQMTIWRNVFNWSSWLQSALIAFSPPAVLLLLGFLGEWIVAGFRKSA